MSVRGAVATIVGGQGRACRGWPGGYGCCRIYVVAIVVPPAAWVKDVLRKAGAAHRYADLGIDRARFRWAVLNGAQIRERFTSLDLAWACGVLPEALDAIIDGHLEA